MLKMTEELAPVRGNVAIDMEYQPRTQKLWTCLGGLRVRDQTGWKAITTADGLLYNNCISLAALAGGDVWLGYFDKPAFSLVHQNQSGKINVQNYYQSDATGPADVDFLDTDTARLVVARVWIGRHPCCRSDRRCCGTVDWTG